MVKIYNIGDKNIDANASVFKLVLEDHIQYVDPKEYNIYGEQGIDPGYYFITSGDAVEKAKVMERDFWRYAGELRTRCCQHIANEFNVDIKEAKKMYKEGKRPKRLKKFGEYEAAIWSAAGKARSLLNALKKAKGDNIFLETEWEDHTLYCTCKNPRMK